GRLHEAALAYLGHFPDDDDTDPDGWDDTAEDRGRAPTDDPTDHTVDDPAADAASDELGESTVRTNVLHFPGPTVEEPR
ncbi:MAG TPA: hypothetical protein VK948_03595, partial [Aeromicrobium sp.]|nr:hypothetical protein [Aeromicrobium sp.]